MNFRQKLGKILLNQSLKGTRRSIKVHNLRTITNIGLVYSLTSDDEYQSISGFVELLQKEGKHVKALGFVKSKFETEQYLPKLTYDYFYQKNLNWFHIPKSHYVTEFIEEEFELLIDLSCGEVFPIQYVVALSHANMKVGQDSQQSTPYYDMIVNRKENTTISQHIDNIIHYLKIINSKENALSV